MRPICRRALLLPSRRVGRGEFGTRDQRRNAGRRMSEPHHDIAPWVDTLDEKQLTLDSIAAYSLFVKYLKRIHKKALEIDTF